MEWTVDQRPARHKAERQGGTWIMRSLTTAHIRTHEPPSPITEMSNYRA